MDMELRELVLNCVIAHGSGTRIKTHTAKFNLTHLRGRCNLAVLTRERLLVIKLDGWPEVKDVKKVFVKLVLL